MCFGSGLGSQATIRYVQLFVHLSTYRVRDLSGLSPNSRFQLGWKNPGLKHRNVIHYVKKKKYLASSR